MAVSVLLLGSGGYVEELTAAFRRLGVTVHHAPADVAADGVALRHLVEEHGVDHVVPLVEDVDVEMLVELEKQGVGVVPSAKGCALTLARDTLRRVANEDLGLPTTAYRFADTTAELRSAVEELGLPCIVKPAKFSSGRGHTVVRSMDDLDAAEDDRRRIVERFVDFDHELTLLAVRSIDPATGKLSTWFCEPVGHIHREGRLQSAWQPMALGQRALENARSMAARITNALGGRGLYAVEMFVAGDDVYFSAVTPRPHEAGAVTMCSQRFSQYDLHARAILGLPIDTTLVSPGACTMLYEELSDPAAALSVPESDLRLEGERGVALATAESVDEARDRASRIAEQGCA
ncbi:ATP-grasp domain-containing protein [Corynebacterium comes]|uniref:Phosphoribosylglycinamide formyltransferase 2 n=1 Tax=Corynebacterium comes TaxID=2675218 RepID=A0A6B8VNJ8_9CORY|nr:ATP-grasp domain-containing protein [Corynebacterium comes]QGU05613.1 Phosphoribosylglycinamide formyltransferase 2 [Corynebacterium comes]